MNKSLAQMRVILIGGSSHAGKSTLAEYTAAKLNWNYLSTDKLARHPGRPWVGANGKAIPENVAEHYRNLSTDGLFSDVLSHYEKNVLPQVEDIVSSQEYLIIEGSALYPGLVANLVNENHLKAIWLTARDRLFQNRIYNQSNFNNLGEDKKYLIQKFLERTLLYNKRMMELVEQLGFISIDVESTLTVDELANKSMELMSEKITQNLTR
ncbi:2-phosphoglycerate kinase [Rivularia sp. UHCC 0363]|uniref:2-phosphoglycerate kinase n=1 Tax=Rivularia sp. UHCC 0363 TaxID=3110244 RepID=UPI002B20C083|nr:2-phosphoglycerate kinase [Rivularia sp. UHCC 0363]MEA5595471.1 2-phosphoglycerate kinase [Rivularia sp. UHCC 0363]